MAIKCVQEHGSADMHLPIVTRATRDDGLAMRVAARLFVERAATTLQRTHVATARASIQTEGATNA